MATDFTSTINGYYQAVQYRNAPAADLAVYNASLQSGSLTTAQVQAAILNDPYTTNFVNPVIREYQAAFGRVPDQAGLAYWVGQVATNPNALAQLNVIFANSTEFQTRFGANATTPASPSVVTALYTNVLGRAPDAAGLAYWQSQNLTASQLLQAFAQSGEFISQTNAAVTQFETLEITGGTVPTTGSLFNVAGPSVPGSTLALTAGVDVLAGTSGNDVFIGSINATAAATTINPGDNIDGGNGIDTFRVVDGSGASNAITGVTLKNVEIVELNGGTQGKVLTFDANGITGLTNVNAIGTGDVTVLNIGNASFGVNGLSITDGATHAYTAAGAKSVNLTGDTVATGSTVNVDVSGGTGVATLALTNSGSTAATVSNLKIGGGTTTDTTGLAITASANIKTTITEATANKLQTITAAGTAASVDVGTIASTALKSVDASGLTAGGMKIGLGANVATTFKGGAGSDTVTIATGVAMTGTIDAGAGTDTLSISQTITKAGGAQASTSLTAATKGLFTNFEVLQVAATAAGGGINAGDIGTFDASNLPAGITSFAVGTSTAGVSLLNLAAAPSVKVVGSVSGVDGLAINLKDASGASDVVNLELNNGSTATTGNVNGITIATLSVPGVETLNIASNGSVLGSGTINAISALNTTAANEPNKIVITGAQAFSLTTGAITKPAMTIDGSAATGELTINASAAAAAATSVNINGGAANDTLSMANLSATATLQTVYGAGGGDVINLNATHNEINTLVYKAGTDSLQDFLGTSGASGTITANTGKMDVVNNFIAGQDKVDLTNIGGFSASQKGVVVKAFASTTAISTAEAQAGFFNDATNTQKGVVLATQGGDTYAIIDANHDGVFQAGSDLVIKMAGITNLTTADFNFG